MPKIMKKFFDLWNSSEEEEYDDEQEDIEYESEKNQKKESKNGESKILSIYKGRTKISCFKPDDYNGEIAEIANSLISGDVIVIDLEIESTSPDISRRIIDFLRGTVHAIKGKFVKVSRNTYVLSPNNVEINGTELINELENHDICI